MGEDQASFRAIYWLIAAWAAWLVLLWLLLSGRARLFGRIVLMMLGSPPCSRCGRRSLSGEGHVGRDDGWVYVDRHCRHCDKCYVIGRYPFGDTSRFELVEDFSSEPCFDIKTYE